MAKKSTAGVLLLRVVQHQRKGLCKLITLKINQVLSSSSSSYLSSFLLTSDETFRVEGDVFFLVVRLRVCIAIKIKKGRIR